MEMVAAEVVDGNKEGVSPTYCVTGATRYIGSWLVKTLLERGNVVHATARDPGKALHLLSLWTSGDRLRLFRADMQEEGSFDDAVRGCDGVFHVAASMEFDVPTDRNVVRGTENLLKSCLKSKTVERVVFTSYISTLTSKDKSGKWRAIVDESCQSPVDHVWNTKPRGWVYVLSKLLTEEAAFKFAKDSGMDLVSVIAPTVAGPFITSSVPSSIQVLMSPITGNPKFYSILCAVNTRMGSIALAHIEDICCAHIFLMRQNDAQGKYICCASSCLMSELVSLLVQEYPCSNIQRLKEDPQGPIPSQISSKKLRDLGLTFKHDIEDIIHQTIAACVDHGFLLL